MSIKKNGLKSNEEEEMKELKGNGEDKAPTDKTSTDKAPTDAEKGTKENGGKAKKRSEQQLLLGPEEIERYCKNPFWKALRFALFGSLVCLFLLLVVVAVLIVALSSKCAGGNEIGGTATTIDLLAGKAAKIGNFPLKQSLVVVREGQSASFHCENVGGKIRWHRKRPNGEKEEEKEVVDEQSKDMELFNNGTLHIRNVKLEQKGEYICEGMAHFWKEWHRLANVKLEVTPKGTTAQGEDGQQQQTNSPAPSSAAFAFSPLPPPSRAQFTSLPRVDSHLKLAFAGEMVHFRCWMDGKSSDDLSWQKVTADAQRSDAGEGVSLLAAEPDGQSAFLVFGAVKESDAGEYRCVEGHGGANSPMVRLRVEPSRSPVVEPIKQLVHEHLPAQIRCSVPGHPNAQLIWRRENGVEVGTMKGVTDDGKGTLRLAEVRREHEHMGWVCWAVYSHMADKQALSAGPVVIRVIPGREESGTEGETTEKQREEEGEEGSGQEEESGREGEEARNSEREEEERGGNSEGETEQREEEESGRERETEKEERNKITYGEGEKEEQRDKGEGGQAEKEADTENDH